MLPLRWRSAAQSRGLLQTPSTLRLRGPLAPASHPLRQRAALPGRVESPLSRVSSQHRAFVSPSPGIAAQSRRVAVPSRQHASRRVAVPSRQHASATTILRSAFPTKTAIFLLIACGLAYLVIEVRENSWAEVLLATSEKEGHNLQPLHFNANKDELDHWLQFHMPASGNQNNLLKDPDFVQKISASFNEIVSGWMMTEQEAKDDNLPVTHGCRFMCNEPCEDLLALGTNPGPGDKPWNYWSIMDGHAGYHTAAYLQRVLIPFASHALTSLPRTSGPVEIENTIKETFLRIDKQIMDVARTAASWYPAGSAPANVVLGPALSGSCALLAAFDPEKSTLRVACTGDSRAVLGRWDESSNSYKCIPLSEDQTGFNPKEVARLAEAHPDEPDIIDPKTGRLLGIAITRAFGDHRWKWDNAFIKSVQEKFWGTAPRPGSKSPPYLTAEPEVTETEIVRVDPHDKSSRGKSDFMIMASDGLWDRISSEHAVACVDRWLDAKARGKGLVSRDPQLLANPPSYTPAHGLEAGVDVVNGELEWKATPAYFAIEDDNAAVCLARNAMGGTRRNLFLGVISVFPPWARNAVDDTTIMVVFFDALGAGQHGSNEGQTTQGKWWLPTHLLGLGKSRD